MRAGESDASDLQLPRRRSNATLCEIACFISRRRKKRCKYACWENGNLQCPTSNCKTRSRLHFTQNWKSMVALHDAVLKWPCTVTKIASVRLVNIMLKNRILWADPFLSFPSFSKNHTHWFCFVRFTTVHRMEACPIFAEQVWSLTKSGKRHKSHTKTLAANTELRQRVSQNFSKAKGMKQSWQRRMADTKTRSQPTKNRLMLWPSHTWPMERTNCGTSTEAGGKKHRELENGLKERKPKKKKKQKRKKQQFQAEKKATTERTCFRHL